MAAPESYTDVARRRELRELAWAVLFLLLFALFVGGLLSRYLGSGFLILGLGLAVLIVAAFSLIVGLNLLGVSLWRAWERRQRESGA